MQPLTTPSAKKICLELVGRKRRPAWAILLRVLLLATTSCEIAAMAAEPTSQGNSELPYMDTSRGREGHSLSNHRVNSRRLYDFYSRQAEYYLDGHELPKVLPAYPGLDGGDFGHWGKFSKNNFSSDRWDQMDLGSVVGGVFRHGSKKPIPRAVTLRLGEAGSLAACFDPATLSYREIWKNGFVEHGERRWGLVSGITLDGTPLLTTIPSIGWSRDGTWKGDYPKGMIDYKGYYRHGKRAVFSYEVNGVAILDSPWARSSEAGPIMTRSLWIGDPLTEYQVQLFQAPSADSQWRRINGERVLIISHGAKRTACMLREDAWKGAAKLALTRDQRVVAKLSAGDAKSYVTVRTWTGKQSKLDAALDAMSEGARVQSPARLRGGGPSQWPETVTLSGELGENRNGYAIDRIPVPIEDNPYKSLMFLSGIGFFKNGDAVVCTITGDVWRIRGLDEKLSSVRWKRYASGLNQALGLVMVDNKPAVLGRDQITLLHDLNGDNEADFYESFCHKFQNPTGGHSFLTGLERDAEGNLYFASQTPGVTRISPDGKTVERLATGLRNPNGLGVRSDGLVVTAPQEGTWTPTSMICEVNEGDFFGLWPQEGQTITPPLCFVPRGVDPSTGGQCFVEDQRFGPLNGQLLSFSWNHSSYYMVLRDEVDGTTQGAAVPLPGDFRAAAHRGQINRHDGSLYVVCSDGWGTYATQHGALHRVRYTGKKAYLPKDFHAYENGISVTFTEKLDPETVTDTDRFFAQQWEYVYSKNYGSPEFSVRHPEKEGHDPLGIESVHLLNDNRTLFLEIPAIRPVMQLHLHGRLAAADGHSFVTDLFPTLHRLDEPFKAFPGYRPTTREKPAKLSLRIRRPEPSSGSQPETEAEQPKDERTIVIKAVTGLRYNRETIRVRAGEPIALRVENTDVIPHNLVIVRPGKMEAVGHLADRLIGSPNAVKQDYVPQSDHVLHHTRVVKPEQSVTIRFSAPNKPGKYPYICTFPGHWRVMNGKMIVEPKKSR